MAARHKARKRALDILFQSDVRGADPLDVLAEARRLRREDGDSDLNPYVDELISGVVQHQGRIDDVLSTYSLGWTLERMPGVDRAILRLATYELLWSPIPDAVVIDEAVTLARELSTDDSPSFVNGLLGRIANQRETLDLEV